MEGLSEAYLAADLRDYTIHRIDRVRREGCPTCGSIRGDCAEAEEDIEVSLDEVLGASTVKFVDVTIDKSGKGELDCNWANSVEEAVGLGAKRIILVCKRGRASLKRAYIYRDAGYGQIYSLRGGYSALPKARG
jgi:rhodanese-related sulfurtransferase